MYFFFDPKQYLTKYLAHSHGSGLFFSTSGKKMSFKFKIIASIQLQGQCLDSVWKEWYQKHIHALDILMLIDKGIKLHASKKAFLNWL